MNNPIYNSFKTGMMMAGIVYVLFLSCKSGKNTVEKADDYKLQGIWVLKDVPGKEFSFSGKFEIYLDVEVDSARVNGFTGCNRLNAEISIENGKLRFKSITTSRKMCDDVPWENAYLTILKNIDEYKLLKNRLLLKSPTGEIKLIFRRKE